MNTSRLEAFSDGVIAIIVTIMVLELRVPEDGSLAGLRGLWPVGLAYLLSFVMVAIYWVNHHSLIRLVRHAGGAVLWANLNLLFWLSLVPFATAYLGRHRASPLAVGLYATLDLVCGLAYLVLHQVIVAAHPQTEAFCRLHRHLAVKNLAALGIYGAAVAAAPVSRVLSLALVALPAVMFFLPDRRLAAYAAEHEGRP